MSAHTKKSTVAVQPSVQPSHVNLASPTPVGGANALPQAESPTVPNQRAEATPARGLGPRAAEMKAAPGAAAELVATERYAQVLGAYAPPVEDVANALAFVSAWYTHYAAAVAWMVYARQQTLLAWQYTLPLLDRLRVPFSNALAADASVAKEFADLATVLLARSDTAKKGSKKRVAQNKKAQRAAMKLQAAQKKAQAAADKAAKAQAKVPPSK